MSALADAARAEAERVVSGMDPDAPVLGDLATFAVYMAEWARDHLAAQEVDLEDLAPRATEHWRWAQKRREKYGDQDCRCTTCELYAALRVAARARQEADG